ncbi:DegT/DnrJ/EryC1/StrS family aminotransferase [Paenibacillus radicis (ex Xue et al. 2023)]|uniref:DegT/DnrJ/EryC1/StrS family aminotransferase n=1 Tax=Paenibacillus radicis (ex Xue et al. 2023) TaxID=2972489 RepID=A0ABT1YGA9_9BACL|nr:DegT/DnrJ/EryC1/StrS family aminotransferase [Paenibacillus radicis (ex Xue et al. 2023)]MCR8632238.1 DegT/DnrJ/EryC1/StrS family aminotransferase [Paenibacillus radicis (ex Xue et al. 2023)]
MVKLAIDGGVPTRTKSFPDWPIYGEMEERLLLEVLHSGKWGGTGRIQLPEAEKQFAAIHDAKHAITVVNGTVAITIALQAAGVQPGDEVIMPPYTFFATASAALMFGAIPVFVDVEENTLLLDASKVEAAITPRTKAIVPVHIGGAMADMTQLKAIADKYKLRIIEDSAQAVGARWNGSGAGTIGDLGTFSFQSTKNINSGEGGMILTQSDEMADLAWSLINAGRVRSGEWYQHENVGWNLRMTEFQAAILIAQLSRLEQQMITREKNAKLLEELMRQIEGIRVLDRDPRITRHANHLFLFKIMPELAERISKQEVCRAIGAEGIPVHEGYVSLNLNPAIIEGTRKWTGESRTYSCPVSERACLKEALWMHQNVLLGDEQDMYDIAQGITKVLKSYS